LLLRLDRVSLAFGSRPLLDGVSLTVEAGERVCLVGRNGEGKSSLLRLVQGAAQPDAGTVWIRPGTRVAHLAQDAADRTSATVAEVAASGLADVAALLAEFHALAADLDRTHDAATASRFADLQQRIDAIQGWQVEQRIASVLTRLGLDGRLRFAELSGGWQRRALLAQALVSNPDLLLLDEPTNHLDITAIEWLEQFMLGFEGALLFVSHDRAFVNRLATRVVELDRGRLSSWPGSYDEYVVQKSRALQVEAQQNALFDRKLAQEEVWIRKGIEARRTRNEGRVRALYQLREERRRRRERIGRANIVVQDAAASAQLVFEAEGAGIDFDGHPVIEDFSVRIQRGDRIGIVGPNGAGKSTLIRLLLGDLEPTRGRIRRGERLEVAYYDQQREQLALERTLMDNVGDGNTFVSVGGRSQHVSGYLRSFLFRDDQLNTPAAALSGGERNQLLLARLFTRPANVLVMDEPTNDLDIDTLELLEEQVAAFPGTLLLVSHDRAFLDRVVTSLLVFEGDGRVREFVGGYSDWARDRDARAAASAAAQSRQQAANREAGAAHATGGVDGAVRPKRLSYREQRELEGLPAHIEGLEGHRSRLEAEIGEAGFYERPHEQVHATLERLTTLVQEIDAAYARWALLEGQAAARGA
jgi:ATP-binding cassette subfamily F protein uup